MLPLALSVQNRICVPLAQPGKLLAYRNELQVDLQLLSTRLSACRVFSLFEIERCLYVVDVLTNS